MEGLFGLNILLSVLDLWIAEAIPFLVMIGVISALIGIGFDFVRPFIGFKKY